MSNSGEVNAVAPLWLLIPKAGGAIVLGNALILLICWLRFGELPYFVFGFVIFITVLQILIIIGLRFQNRTEVHTTKPLQRDWIDKIGALWLVACAFGSLLGWICGLCAVAFPNSALPFHLAKIFFTIVLPILTMLPNLRYLEKNAAAIQIPLLFFITSLPILIGVGSLLAVWNYFA